jgi:ribosomal protein S8
MKWRDDLSAKYDQAKAIKHIQNRFNNSTECIYITIGKLKEDPEFHQFINKLREEGWLDWQIILGITNFMLDYKTQRELSQKNFQTEKEYVEAMQQNFHKFLNMDEKDCYILFPLKAFKTPQFKVFLEMYAANVLKAASLENKSRIPNFPAIKEFLDIRFNMRNDNTNEGNPLADIN